MNCDNTLLWTLVRQDTEPGAEAESILQHVESCSQCRETLMQLGGDREWWGEAKEWLSNQPIDPVDEDHETHPLAPIDLSFLHSASHPEMLGRIGRYDVEAVLGRGGMGVVFRAYDSDLHRSVAVKVLAPEWAASVPARERFAREAQAAASVAHENVVPIYDVEPDAKLPYLVMRYISGTTLERWVRANGSPDVATILRVAVQLAEGLAAAHRRGLVHRDIKPANVLVGKNIDRVWITDFGLARAADSATLTRTGVIAGTPHYMSPEQARGEALDGRSDLFSLGCVLYFLATGAPPFDAENTLAVLHKIVNDEPKQLASLRNDLPPSFVALVHQLLSRKPSKRPIDCGSVVQKLENSQTELHDGIIATLPMNKKFRRTLYGTLTVLTTLLLIVTLWNHRQPKKDAVVYRPIIVQQTEDNPFLRAANSSEQFSPYVVQASKQIEMATEMDAHQVESRLGSLRAKLQRAQQIAATNELPLLDFDDRQWREQVSRLRNLIDKADQK
ncbi:Serine/threonine-protein kinase PknB [Planctomycetes bacterium CA13]|uniref:non-specific serine/threonine protein kinase n=1 Tax=Novipirellula herctigrandis TaxID=2527986 RepID=A0A5C5ZAX3_9BACT|nr:Serine/threonine-protein kinase PknB [Planctomycetes bacterium CA13]